MVIPIDNYKNKKLFKNFIIKLRRKNPFSYLKNLSNFDSVNLRNNSSVVVVSK